MSRSLVAVAVCLLAGCAAAEDANNGGDSLDFAVAVDDLASARDLAPRSDGPSGTPGCAAAEHVVVNEVKTGSAASASDEFIELYNPCAQPVDLTGFTVVYRSAAGVADVTPPVVSLTKTIDGHGWLLIAGPAYSNGGTPNQTYGAGKLAAAGGGVGVRDGAQALIDSVGYGTATNMFVEGGAAAAAPPNDQSIARVPNGIDTGHSNLDFAVATTPTPRAAN